MTHRDRYSVLTVLVVILVGSAGGTCAAPETPAMLTAGSGSNPLDGAVIEDDGRQIDIDLNADGSAIGTVMVSGVGGGTIEFDEVGMVVVPRTVVTGADNTIEISRDTELVTVGLSLPVVGRVEFMGTIPDELTVTRELFLAEERDPAGAVDRCPVVVDGTDAFCARFRQLQSAARVEIVGFLGDLLAESIGAQLAAGANGALTEFVNGFFNVIGNFCGGWSEVRDGTSETDPVDPCAP